MRAAFFIVYLFSFFLKGNHYVLEPRVQDKFVYSQSVDKQQRSKFLNPDQGNTVDENADLDEEEHHPNDDLNDDLGDDAQTFAFDTHFNLPQDWFFSIAGLYFNTLHASYEAVSPRTGYSSKIYIVHRVLRI